MPTRNRMNSNTGSYTKVPQDEYKIKQESNFLNKWLLPILCTIWMYCSIAFVTGFVWFFQKVINFVNSIILGKRVSDLDRYQQLGSLFRESVQVICIYLNPFWKRTVKYDIEKKEIPKKAIYMSNHISFSDAYMCSGVFPESKYVAQSILFDLPIAGEILRQVGDMAVFFEKREDGTWGTVPGSREALIANAKRYLENGIPLTVMPEGTISKNGKMNEFKRGFFKLAIETEADIVPFSLWGNHKCWPMDTSVNYSIPSKWMYPGHGYVHVGKPIKTKGRTIEDLIKEVRDTIEHMRITSPTYDGDVDDE